jgi:hypothetical protein
MPQYTLAARERLGELIVFTVYAVLGSSQDASCPTQDEPEEAVMLAGEQIAAFAKPRPIAPLAGLAPTQARRAFAIGFHFDLKQSGHARIVAQHSSHALGHRQLIRLELRATRTGL